MVPRSLLYCTSLLAAIGLVSAGVRAPDGLARAVEVLPSFAPVFTSAPAPSPTFTPLPPPIWPPSDARGGAHTTPPTSFQASEASPTLPPDMWLSTADALTVQGEIHGGVLYVPVVVNGQRMLFLVDTAGPTLVEADELGEAGADGAQIRTLQVGDVHFNDLVAQVARVRSFARDYLGAPADGVLGQDLFARFAASLDYTNATLTIYRTSAAASAAKPADAVSLTLQSVRGYPIVSGAIDDADGSFIVDSLLGGYVTLGWNFARMRRLIPGTPAVSELRLTQPSGDLGGGRTLRLRSLTLGSLSLLRPIAGVFGSTPESSAMPDTAGVIGSDLLDRFFVMMDEPAGRVMLAPRTGATAEPLYDRSGLWLVGSGDSVVVKSVLGNSPADRAGMRGGDVLVQLDGARVHPADLDRIRSRLADPAVRSVSVIFVHGTRERRATITLRLLL